MHWASRGCVGEQVRSCPTGVSSSMICAHFICHGSTQHLPAPLQSLPNSCSDLFAPAMPAAPSTASSFLLAAHCSVSCYHPPVGCTLQSQPKLEA